MKVTLSHGVLLFILMAMQGCSTTDAHNSQLILLADNGQCTMLSHIEKRVCIKTEDADEGDVTMTLHINGAVRPLIEVTSYLTAAYVIASPTGKYIAVVKPEEGHPVYAFYKTRSLLNNRNNVSPLMILDDINLSDFEFLKDNGDIAYSLTEGAFVFCHTDEVEFVEESQSHTEPCVIGVNIETKQALSF